MKRFRIALGALLVALPTLSVPMVGAPVAAANVDNSDPSRFIETLSSEAFTVLHTGTKASARGQFRSLLGQYFAIDEMGDKLTRRCRPSVPPAQYSAYKSALPGFLIGTYADRLYD